MQLQTLAIVLHSTAYNDRYAIVHLYTLERGRLGVLVPRGGRLKGKHHLLLVPLSEVELSLELRPHRDLAILRESKAISAHHGIQMNPAKCSQVIFLSELLYRILSQPEPDSELYGYISSSLVILDRLESGVANFYLCFVYRMLRFLAISPEGAVGGGRVGSCEYDWFDLMDVCYTPEPRLRQYALPPEEAKHLRLFSRITFDNLAIFRYNRHDRALILDRLMLFYRLHLPPFPALRSIEILRASATSSLGGHFVQ